MRIIIALNKHAAILHYNRQKIEPPEQIKSFLIDAGAEFCGYAADVSRTHTMHTNSLYSQLIDAVNQTVIMLISEFKLGISFTHYHLRMHQLIAQILLKFNIAKNISAEALIMKNLTNIFIPHGLGHLLGLQVHDVGGYMQDDHGTLLMPSSDHAFLRCTRQLQASMVLTVEPGFYLIESLLQTLRQGDDQSYFDWRIIDELIPYGGIRIEDNIVIHANRIENLTRDLKLA